MSSMAVKLPSACRVAPCSVPSSTDSGKPFLRGSLHSPTRKALPESVAQNSSINPPILRNGLGDGAAPPNHRFGAGAPQPLGRLSMGVIAGAITFGSPHASINQPRRLFEMNFHIRFGSTSLRIENLLGWPAIAGLAVNSLPKDICGQFHLVNGWSFKLMGYAGLFSERPIAYSSWQGGRFG